MNAMKSAAPIANWLFRVSFLLYGVLANYQTFSSFDFTSKAFVLGTLFMVLSVLLFVGGFFKTDTMTVLSALGLVCLSVSQIIISWNGDITQVLAVQLLIVSVAFYFLAGGNNG
ncbi:MAG: hypothetical protein MH137_00260 [Flavobacteriales bacterium]|nr:hypothetical protein [Flavobacteriales bacterium]